MCGVPVPFICFLCYLCVSFLYYEMFVFVLYVNLCSGTKVLYLTPKIIPELLARTLGMQFDVYSSLRTLESIVLFLFH